MEIYSNMVILLLYDATSRGDPDTAVRIAADDSSCRVDVTHVASDAVSP